MTRMRITVVAAVSRARTMFKEINTTLAAYIRAQLLACVFVGAICGIGSSVLGVPYPVFLSRHPRRSRRLGHLSPLAQLAWSQ